MGSNRVTLGGAEPSCSRGESEWKQWSAAVLSMGSDGEQNWLPAWEEPEAP